MFVLTALLACATGLVRGGRLRAFSDVRFRCAWLVFVAFGLRLGLDLSGSHGWTGIGPWAPAVHLCSYALLLYALWRNRRLPGIWLLIAGTVLNAAVIAANGARMPVSPPAVIGLGEAAEIPYLAGHGDFMHSLMSSSTRLPWLGDRFALAFPSPSVFSAGDVLVVLGLFVLIQGVMVSGRRWRTAPSA